MAAEPRIDPEWFPVMAADSDAFRSYEHCHTSAPPTLNQKPANFIRSPAIRTRTRFLEIISLRCLSAVVCSSTPALNQLPSPVIMVVYYQLAGKQVGSHVLAMGVLGSLFGGVYLATRGGSQPKQAAPPIQASSKDEETFIQYVLPLRCLSPFRRVMSDAVSPFAIDSER
ncbi:hypothetical protein AFGD_010380 [Aspergillus flavus]|nr:hypothetical protein AFGD_010380 [Aspergillus flavus]